MNTGNCSRAFQILLSSFNGCMLGGLLGDVYGLPFERSTTWTKDDATRYFRKECGRSKGDPENPYSDDTVMTLDIVKSLIKYPNFNAEDMANNFAESSMCSLVDRHYGARVTQIFDKWVTNNFRDLWTPAEQQFRGKGSFGNGAAMRVSPVGLLFFAEDQQKEESGLKNVVEMAIKTSLLTHTSPEGVGGCVFQAIAIRNTLQCRIDLELKKGPDSIPPFCSILNGIEQDLKSVRSLGTIKIDLDSSKAKVIDTRVMCDAYISKLNITRELLEAEDGSIQDTQVVSKLGNGVAAINSVPTALYCFLKCLKEKYEDKAELFSGTLQYAVSLRGDTDTIASMAGSLAGTFVGGEEIPKNMQTNAEGVDEINALAKQLFDQFYSSSSNDSASGSNSKI